MRVVKEKVLADANLSRLEIALHEADAKPGVAPPEQERLGELQRDIAQAEKNLARAKTDEDYAAVSRQLAEWRQEANGLRDVIRGLASPGTLSAAASLALSERKSFRDNVENAPREKLADCLKMAIQRIDLLRVDLGVYNHGRLRGWSAEIHFIPQIHPHPVPLTDEHITPRDTFRSIIEAVRLAGRPMRVKEISSAIGAIGHAPISRHLARAARMGILRRLPKYGGWEVAS